MNTAMTLQARRPFIRGSINALFGGAGMGVPLRSRGAPDEALLLAQASRADNNSGEITHRVIDTNGIKMHIAEKGQGPLVVLCHGFPETWYSWRHQIPAIAAAGFHVVAPDQRGYGESSRPDAIDAYAMHDLVGDIVGLVQALGKTEAIVIGHDWGAPVAWNCGLLRPDIVRAVGLLSVPYLMRLPNEPRPTDFLKKIAGANQFYQLYFQEPGRAEAEMEADVRRTMRGVLYSAAGDPPPAKRWRFLFGKNERFMDTIPEPDVLPSWLSEADIDTYARVFAVTGFRGGLNWYRNMDRNWERTSFLTLAPLRQPTVYVAGENDAVLLMQQQAYDALHSTVPNLRKKEIVPSAGHWVHQERAQVVNQHLLDFLKSL